MRKIIAILFLFNVIVLQGLEPEFDFIQENIFTTIAAPIVKTTTSVDSKATGFFNKINTFNSLVSYFSAAHRKIYRKERIFIKSRFSGRTAPLLKASNMKLSYKYVVVPVPVNQTISKRRAFLLNSSPFVSVLLNRKSIYSDAYAFHGNTGNDQVDSLHDLGVSIGAGIRVPITSRFYTNEERM